MKKFISLGIIGHPIGHTLSPLMHETAARSLGIDLSYKAYDVTPEKLTEFMDRFRGGDIDGLNVTVPHKVAVMEFMDELSGEALGIGAVNTIVSRNGKLTGHNTDGYGFLTAMVQNANEDMNKKRVLVYGAGGAARAICNAIDWRGYVHIIITNRSRAKAEDLQKRLGQPYTSIEVVDFDSNKLVDSIKTADIIINTTSMGMEGTADKLPPGVEGISKRHLVVDIVYRPLQTPLLKEARARGAGTLDGLWMLIHQGARSFELWTGEKFPVELARKKLLSELNKN